MKRIFFGYLGNPEHEIDMKEQYVNYRRSSKGDMVKFRMDLSHNLQTKVDTSIDKYKATNPYAKKRIQVKTRNHGLKNSIASSSSISSLATDHSRSTIKMRKLKMRPKSRDQVKLKKIG